MGFQRQQSAKSVKILLFNNANSKCLMDPKSGFCHSPKLTILSNRTFYSKVPCTTISTSLIQANKYQRPNYNSNPPGCYNRIHEDNNYVACFSSMVFGKESICQYCCGKQGCKGKGNLSFGRHSCHNTNLPLLLLLSAYIYIFNHKQYQSVVKQNERFS